MATTYHTSDDAGYWAEQDDILSGARARREAAALAATMAAAQEREDAEWTREVAVARRAAWNEAVRSPEYRGKNGGVAVAFVIRDLGFHPDSLKRQITRHGL